MTHSIRVAVITGGSSGIGAAIGQRLVASGLSVTSLDISPPPTGSPVSYEACDVGDPEQVTHAIATVERQLGPPDVVVHAAGITATGLIGELADKDWDRVLATNLTGAFNVLRATMPGMISRRCGRILTIGSGTAVRVTVGRCAYASTKAGLIALTKVAALEGAPHGVTANVIAPGVTDTPMTRQQYGSREALAAAVASSPIANPMGVVMDPEDIAAVAAFFCSADAWPVTGQVLHVSAGSVMP